MKPKGYIGNADEKVTEVKEDTSVAIDQDIIAKMKAHMENTSIHPTKSKRDEWDNKESVKGAKSKADAVQARLNEHAGNISIHVSKAEKVKYLDKYTRAETDNKIAAASMGIIWLDPVDTYEEFQRKYEKKAAKEGYFVFIQKESRALRYTNGAWRAVNFHIYPLADEGVNGLMSATDKAKLNTIDENANYYVHPSDEETKHVSIQQIAEWTGKADKSIVDYYHAGLMTPEMLKKLNAIVVDENDIKVARLTNIPVVKESINTVTIGPAGSSADFIYDAEKGLDNTFNRILENLNVRTIKLLYNVDGYQVKSTIHLKGISLLSIIGEGKVRIENRIPYVQGSKQPRYVFELDSATDINFQNIIFDCFDTEEVDSDEKGAIFGGIRFVEAVSGNAISNCNFWHGIGVMLSGYYNIIERCNLLCTDTGIYLRSFATLEASQNHIDKCHFDKCKTAIAVATYKSDCMYNQIMNNIIENCLVGIDIRNDAISYEAIPSYNMIKDNTIYRGMGSPKDYKIDEYTIRVNGCDNIITTNLLRGKDVVVETFSKQNIIHNYVK